MNFCMKFHNVTDYQLINMDQTTINCNKMKNKAYSIPKHFLFLTRVLNLQDVFLLKMFDFVFYHLHFSPNTLHITQVNPTYRAFVHFSIQYGDQLTKRWS